jgi:hypothetical protein
VISRADTHGIADHVDYLNFGHNVGNLFAKFVKANQEAFYTKKSLQ